MISFELIGDNCRCFTFNLDSKIIESNLVDDFTEMGYGSVGYSLKKQLIVGRKSGLEVSSF